MSIQGSIWAKPAQPERTYLSLSAYRERAASCICSSFSVSTTSTAPSGKASRLRSSVPGEVFCTRIFGAVTRMVSLMVSPSTGVKGSFAKAVLHNGTLST